MLKFNELETFDNNKLKFSMWPDGYTLITLGISGALYLWALRIKKQEKNAKYDDSKSDHTHK